MNLVKLWTPKNAEYALTFPLGLLCIVLGSVLLLESLVVQRSGSDSAQTAGALEGASPENVEPEVAFELPPLDAFSPFVDRPLFMEGRKPAVEGEQAQAPQEEDLTPLTLTLMGVMFTPRGEMAIVAEASGKNRRVRMSGTIGGWRLVEVKPDRVTLQRGEERRDLPLMKPRPKGPATAAPPGQPAMPAGVPQGARRGRRPLMPDPPAELNEPDVDEMDDTADAADPAEDEE